MCLCVTCLAGQVVHSTNKITLHIYNFLPPPPQIIKKSDAFDASSAFLMMPPPVESVAWRGGAVKSLAGAQNPQSHSYSWFLCQAFQNNISKVKTEVLSSSSRNHYSRNPELRLHKISDRVHSAGSSEQITQSSGAQSWKTGCSADFDSITYFNLSDRRCFG